MAVLNLSVLPYRYSAGQNAIEYVYELARAVYPEHFADER